MLLRRALTLIRVPQRSSVLPPRVFTSHVPPVSVSLSHLHERRLSDTSSPIPPSHLNESNDAIALLIEKQRYEEAFDKFVDMPDEGCTPSMFSFQMMLEGMAAAGRPDLVEAVHIQAKFTGRRFSPRMYSALLRTYGRHRNAVKVISTTHSLNQAGVEPTLALYGTLVFANYTIGRKDEALGIVEQYRLSGLPMKLLYTHIFAGFRRLPNIQRSLVDTEMYALREHLLTDLIASLGVSSQPVSPAEVLFLVRRSVHVGFGLVGPILELGRHPHLLDMLDLETIQSLLRPLWRMSRIPPAKLKQATTMMVWCKDSILAHPDPPVTCLSSMLSFFMSSRRLPDVLDVLHAAEKAEARFNYSHWLPQLAALGATAEKHSPESGPLGFDAEGFAEDLKRWETVLLHPEAREAYLNGDSKHERRSSSS